MDQRRSVGSPCHHKTVFWPDDPIKALPAVGRLWPSVDNDEDEEDDDMFYEERTGDGNVTFSDKLPPTLLNHAKMMAIESIPLKDVLL